MTEQQPKLLPPEYIAEQLAKRGVERYEIIRNIARIYGSDVACKMFDINKLEEKKC